MKIKNKYACLLILIMVMIITCSLALICGALLSCFLHISGYEIDNYTISNLSILIWISMNSYLTYKLMMAVGYLDEVCKVNGIEHDLSIKE